MLGEIPGGDSPNYNGDTYIATRTPTGWVTHYVGIRGDEHRAGLEEFASSTSLEKFIDFARKGEPGASAVKLPMPGTRKATPSANGPLMSAQFPVAEASNGMFQPSPDFSHLAFSSSNVVFPTEEGQGQPTHQGQITPPGSAYDYDTMSADHRPHLRASKRRRLPTGTRLFHRKPA